MRPPASLARFTRSRQASSIPPIPRLAAARTFASQSQIPGFRIDSEHASPEFGVVLTQLTHVRTGARLAHLATRDRNKALGIVFKTPPRDDTGVPHILEHVALCGSQAFPVRDPFFKMLKRSLSNFMNAMTAQDYTMYPFATVLAKDWENLLRVYVDATFFPLLREGDFAQEGHRLEFDKEGKLIRSGVVFNEMKGHLSDSSSAFEMRLQRLLFGPSRLGYVSGGDPAHIPELTHQGLVDFHSKHYCASNALFVSYGDVPLQHTCELLCTLALDRLPDAPKSTFISPTAALDNNSRSIPALPSKAETSIVLLPPDKAGDTKLTISRAWRVPGSDSWDKNSRIEASMLSTLLLDGPQAPVHAALIDSGLAPGYAPMSGLDAATGSFALGAMGARDEEHVAQCEEAIGKGLTEAASQGFDSQRVEGVLHQIELGLRHRRANFGLSMVSRCAQAWARGWPVEDAIPTPAAIEHLRSIGDWKSRAEAWALQGWNQPLVRLLGKPSATLVDEQQQAERAALDAMVVDKAQIARAQADLARMRESDEDVSVLPTLAVSDIPVSPPEREQIRATAHPGVMALDTDTNGVGYVRVKLPLSSPPARLLPVICSLLGSVAAGGRDYKALDQALSMQGGSLSLGTRIVLDYATGDFAPVLVAEWDVLKRNASTALPLMGDVLLGSDVADSARVRTLLASMEQATTASLVQDPLSYARLAARAPHGEAHARLDVLFGTPKARLMQQLTSVSQWAPLGSPQAQLCIVADDVASFEPHAVALRERLASASVAVQGNDNELAGGTQDAPTHLTYLRLPVPVHYTHAVINTNVRFGHADFAALQVLSVLLQHEFLHREVREKGGAYGASASMTPDGLFAQSSLWDPALVPTLETYARGLGWLCETTLAQRAIDEALLSLFSDLDAPTSPASKGASQWMHGMTETMRSQHRASLLGVDAKELARVAQRYLAIGAAPGSFLRQSTPALSVCVVGSKGPREDGLPENEWVERVM